MIVVYSGLKKLLYKLIGNPQVYYKAKKSTSYIVTTIVFILVGRIWFEGVQSFMTFVGLFSAALAIVMKDVILNIAGWIYIIFKSPFRVGDRVEIDGVAGDIIDIQLFSFTIMEIRNWVLGDKYTARVIYMPNVTIFNKPLSNFNKEIPFIWNELTIAVPFNSNWKKSKEIIKKATNNYSSGILPEVESSLKGASRVFALNHTEIEPKIYTKIDSSSANITFIIRYMCPYKSKRGSAEKIYEDILNEFSRHEDIQFSYPINIIQLKEENKNL